jgi:hypothetical protein
VSNGKYYIGMYSLREIDYGEELTFDYCSMTETETEYKKAICLCGTNRCRGRYLELSNSKNLNCILDREYCFLARNANLLRACEGGEPDQEGLALLQKYNILNSVGGGAPAWLLNWCVDCLAFLQDERPKY